MNQAHLHVLLTHGPVAGIFFGLLILGYGLWRENRSIVQVGLALFILTGFFATGLYLTGEGAEEVVENLATVEHEAIEAHEGLAQYALIGSLLLAAASIWGLIRSAGSAPGRIAALSKGLFAAGLVVAGLISWTAYRGGRINHPEFRSSPPAQVESGEEIESEHE